MAESPLLSVEGVCRDFGTQLRTRVLDHIDLRIDRGELVALVGPSGSGKSTLLNIIGLLDRPTSGRVVLAGTDTSGLDDGGLTAMRAHTLGFIFQFHHLLPAFTALENVLLPAWGEVGWATRAMRAEAAELLTAVGLADRMNYRITQLSGGQQQRVAIARALSRRPQLVLADEPTGNLDTESATEVFELMRQQNVDRGTTFIVVTHDSRIADRCARVVEIVDGRITAPASGGTPGARVAAGHTERASIPPSLPSSAPPSAALVVP